MARYPRKLKKRISQAIRQHVNDPTAAILWKEVRNPIWFLKNQHLFLPNREGNKTISEESFGEGRICVVH